MKAIYKVEGGKLIKVNLTVDNNKISMINITGDFFCHPEEKFKCIEKNLINTSFSQEEIQKNIQQTIDKENITLVGLSAGDIAQTVVMAK